MTEIYEGVLVAVSARGRLVASVILDVPIHVALARVHDLVHRLRPEDAPW